MAKNPGPPSGFRAGLIPIAELCFGVWFNRPGGTPDMQILPKLTADGPDRIWIRKQPDQGINRYGCIERQEGVHARFLGKVDVEERKSQEHCCHQSHHHTGHAFADQINNRDCACAEEYRKQAGIVGRITIACDPVMEQEIIKGWVLVNPDDPLQHIGHTVVGQPHAERFIQPHHVFAEHKNAQTTTNQCDDENQPGREFFKFAFFVHHPSRSCNPWM